MIITNDIKETSVAIEHSAVNSPSHYNHGSIEVIDYIDDQNFDFCLGNAVKYISRAGYKDNAVQDLKKAIWYLEHEIKLIERKNESA